MVWLKLKKNITADSIDLAEHLLMFNLVITLQITFYRFPGFLFFQRFGLFLYMVKSLKL